MRPFKYIRAADLAGAARSVSDHPGAAFLAGGTNIIDLMKEDVAQPDVLVDLSGIKVTGVKRLAGRVSIPALGKNAETANHPLIRQHFPLLTQAILAGASAQIRNMATNGGNLNQRTRCPYFYEVSTPCNKRAPGSGCSAIKGFNKLHAIFGWSEACVAVHPSDMCVALAALDAVVKVEGVNGPRTIDFAAYHRLPGNAPEKDNTLQRDELITAIELPENDFAANSYYLKVRDRSSYAFALVSVAAAFNTVSGAIGKARIALGSVAHKPWRAMAAEEYLIGKPPVETHFKEAAALAMKDAKPLEDNIYKVELTRRAIVRALMQAAKGGTHAS